MREIAGGDRQAFGELYDRLSASVLSLAWRVLGSRLEAEDIVHDVFLECWRDAARYDPALVSVRTWVLRRARSRALERVRGTGRWATLSLDQAPPRHVAPRTSDPSFESEHHRLGQLSPDQRKVVGLRSRAGSFSSGIARLFGVLVGRVESRLIRAFQRLRRLLSEDSETKRDRTDDTQP